jgi:hypothetical protein
MGRPEDGPGTRRPTEEELDELRRRADARDVDPAEAVPHGD